MSVAVGQSPTATDIHIDYTVHLYARRRIPLSLGMRPPRQPGVVVSESIIQDPEIAAWLAAGGLTAEPFQAELKGYEGERFQLWAARTAA